MLVVKDNPEGIDWYIQRLQNKLHAALITAWGLSGTPAAYECYGRCYRNRRDTGYVAEVYTSKNEYQEIFWNDQLAALSFFGISNNLRFGAKTEADVHLVFFVNLDKIKPSITHRADEEVREEIRKIIGVSSFGFSFFSIDLWLETVLREYSGSYRDNRLSVVDMHPTHCFRINLKLLYNPNNICNKNLNR